MGYGMALSQRLDPETYVYDVTSAMKAVNQVLSGLHIATKVNAATCGMTQGVSSDMFAEEIIKGAGTSWMPENRAQRGVAVNYRRNGQVNI